MRKITWMPIVLALSTAAAFAPVSAQSRRVSLEGRLGTTFPTGELSDLGAESGLLAEGEILYTPSVNFSLFGGIGIHTFNCEEDCDNISTRGLHAGAKYLFGQSRKAMPWVRGALMLHDADAGESTADMGLGYSLGGGIDLAVSEHFTLSPSLRYHQYDADFGSSIVDMSWLSLALGAHYHFF